MNQIKFYIVCILLLSHMLFAGELRLSGGFSNGGGFQQTMNTTGFSSVGFSPVGFAENANHRLQAGFARFRSFSDGFSPITPQLPDYFRLMQNYPNPFNNGTIINFDLAEPTFCTLVIYTLTGQEITRLVNKLMPSGKHTVCWNGTDQENMIMPAGVYFYRISTPGFSQSRKMVFLK